VYDIRCASKKSRMLFSLADRIRTTERVFLGGEGGGGGDNLCRQRTTFSRTLSIDELIEFFAVAALQKVFRRCDFAERSSGWRMRLSAPSELPRVLY